MSRRGLAALAFLVVAALAAWLASRPPRPDPLQPGEPVPTSGEPAGERPAAARPGPLVFSEVAYHPPGDRDALEFLEVYNATDSAVDLTGWTIRGGVRFAFGEGRVAPHECIVVAGDPAGFPDLGADVFGPWRGRLSNRGERVEIVDPAGEVADVVRYRDSGAWPSLADGRGATLERRSSRDPGRLPSNWEALDPESLGSIRFGTPGVARAIDESRAPPSISILERVPTRPTSGDSVTLRLRVEGPAAATVELERDDGAVFAATRDEENGWRVELPAAASGTIVRFVLVARGEDGDEMRLPRPGSETAMLAYHVVDGSPVPSEHVDVIHLSRLPTNHWEEAWTSATFTRDGDVWEVGVKHRGDTSSQRPKAGMRLRFPGDHRFGRATRLNLLAGWEDRSLLREVTAWSLFRELGHPALAARLTRVHDLAGEFLGLYVALEVPSRGFLARYGLDPDGALWKCRNALRGGGAWGIELLLPGDGEATERSRVEELSEMLSRLEGAELIDAIDRHVDVEALLDYQTVKCLISDEDGFEKNWLLHRGTVRDEGGERFVFTVLPWDLDLSFGQINLGDEDIHVTKHPLMGTRDHPRHRRGWNGILDAVFGGRARDWYVRALYGRIWRALERDFSEDRLDPWLDAVDAASLEAAELDLRRWPRWGRSRSHPGIHRETLHQYVRERRRFLRTMLVTSEPTVRWRGRWLDFAYEPAPRVRIRNARLGDDDPARVDIVNEGDSSVDIGGWRLIGPDFTFAPDELLPAGGRVIVARDPSAFAETGDRVLGPWQGTPRDARRTIRLVDDGRTSLGTDHPETIDVVRMRPVD